jgi:hypothetical protein
MQQMDPRTLDELGMLNPTLAGLGTNYADSQVTLRQFREWITEVGYPGYDFRVSESRTGAFYLQAAYMEPDTVSGEQGQQLTRRWLLSPHMLKGELVSTAFLCILTSMEHRVREWFLYKNRPIFHPHYDVDKLAEICEAREVRPPVTEPK